MGAICQDCGCNDVRIQEISRHSFTWNGCRFIHVERAVTCRYCGLVFTDILKEVDEDDASDPMEVPYG